MKLHELSPAPGSTKNSKRLGRGRASGKGKTSGKGHKGQWSRSGGGVSPGFGGGQTKRVMRIPKRGFNNKVFANEYAVVNVRDLEKRFETGAVIDIDAVMDCGLINKPLSGLKILATGELTKKFTVKAAKFSEAAKTKIENAGGTAEIV
ncbi:MAG: 50S ribosomal protein L15 [Oscillospiraceae bacterium]|nr:50S ribosomal protein L15 [Oscillospiraceae bacterium]